MNSVESVILPLHRHMTDDDVLFGTIV